MELRRVQETGGGTILVSLPKEWGRRNGVYRGTLLAIEERSDGCLVLDPYPREEEALQVAVLRYPFMGMDYIEWGLIGAYLLGYDHLQVEAELTIEHGDRIRVKEAVQNLIGLEIVEETGRRIKAQCLIDPSLVKPQTLIQRMTVITLSMLSDAADSLRNADRGLAGSVVRRDDEVDRIYFLLVRLLRSAVQSPKTAESFKVTPLDCLDYRLVASMVESIADDAAGIAEEITSMPSLDLEEDYRESLGEAFGVLGEMLETAMDGFLSHEIKALKMVREAYGRLTGLLDELAASGPIREPAGGPYLSGIFSYMKDVGRGFIDIADLIPPSQVLRVHEEKASEDRG